MVRVQTDILYKLAGFQAPGVIAPRELIDQSFPAGPISGSI